MHILVTGSDPNTNSTGVWGAPIRPVGREEKRKGGHTWWVLVAGD
jgi:hypothetical protein